MKKLLALVLSLVLLVSVVSLSFAAVTVGGNLRVWYQGVEEEGAADPYMAGFRFDRLALTFASELSGVDGFKGEIQLRNPRNDGTRGTDIRTDSAYYYQKAFLLEGDELDIGYLQQVPFKNGAYSVICFDTLADNIVNGQQTLGIKYAENLGQFDFAVAVANANNTYAYDGDNGLEYGLRMNYAVIPGLKIGAGYLKDVNNLTSKNASGATVVNTEDTNSDLTAYVIDATYNIGSLGTYLEYLSATKTTEDKSADAATGAYFEANYKLADAFSVYAAREWSLSEDKNSVFAAIPAMNYADGIGGNLTAKDNWTAVGAKYQMAPNTALQAEYVSIDGDNTNTIAAVRCMVSF